MALHIAAYEAEGVVGYHGVAVEMAVINYCGQFYVSSAYGFKREQGVVDGAMEKR